MDKIAIVILNWNGVGMMEKFLPSVLQYSIEDGATVYVADNASTDNSMQMLKEKFPQVRTILCAPQQRCRGDTSLARAFARVYGQPSRSSLLSAQAAF